MALTSFYRGDVKRTSGATFKTWWIMKDARTIHNFCFGLTTLIGGEPALFFAPFVILPMLWLEAFHRLLHRLQVVIVEKVCTERAATLHELGSWIIMNTLATLAINTLITRTQECRVNHPCTKFFRIFKTDPFVGFFFSEHR